MDRSAPDDDADARWSAKKRHYQQPDVAADYDRERFDGPRGSRSTERKWRAIASALPEVLAPGSTVLDVPCGTGRFTGHLLARGVRVVGADLSAEMLAEARRKSASVACVRCDAERLPFADASFDLVLSVRFLFHVPRELRPAMLREMARVSRRFVVVDVRHKYSLTTQTRRLRAWLRRQRASYRSSLAEIDDDLLRGGLTLLQRIWLSPPLSEKMLLVCEKRRER